MTSIIQQKETKEPFFEIKNIEQIMKATKNAQNDMKKEMEFIEKEFGNLGKNDYIKNDLLNDLNNFSKKDKIKNILQGIIELIEGYKELSGIQLTEFINNLKQINEAIKSKGVSGEDIKKSKDFLLKYKYDIEKESTLLDFYELFVDQKNIGIIPQNYKRIKNSICSLINLLKIKKLIPMKKFLMLSKQDSRKKRI